MSFADESAKLGRIPLEFVELDMDYCGNTYGTSPCAAAVGVTGAERCFNTYGTCQDKDNYTASTKTYRFCQPNSAIPVGVQSFPLLKKVALAPQQLTPGKGLGVRASLTVRFADMPFHDHGIDPYVTTRSYVPEEQGTFWGKFRARNEFYEGRVLRVRTGYLGDGFSWDNFETRAYVIDSFKGPARDGEVQIVAKDVLKLADDNRALCPLPSNGKLSADITSATTTFALTPTGIGDLEYPSGSFRVVIGQEGIAVTRAAGSDTMTVVSRDVYGAGASQDHKAADTVQLVKRWVSQEIQDVFYDLFTNYVPGFDASWITKADWDAERDAYMPLLWTTDICEPTGVNTLLGELQEQGFCYQYWDEVNQKVRLRALRPPEGGLPQLIEGEHFREGSIQAADDAGQRISRFYILYDRKDPTQKLGEINNYRQRWVGADLESEGANEYGTSRIRTIYSRWFGPSSTAQVEALAETMLKRYSKPPRMMQFEADMSLVNTIRLADRFQAFTRQFQDATGAKLGVNFQVVEQAPMAGKTSTTLAIKAQEYVWNERVTSTTDLAVGFSRDDLYELNLYDEFVRAYGTPLAGQNINFIFYTGCRVGSQHKASAVPAGATPAVRLGANWPTGVNITITIQSGARIAGCGGDTAMIGGTGLFLAETTMPSAITIDNQGELWGGGGGGALLTWFNGSTSAFVRGGGGAGRIVGASYYYGVSGGYTGTSGTETTAGSGATHSGTTAGAGGTPGNAGATGTLGTYGSVAQPAGAAGPSVQVKSGVTLTWTNVGDRRGPVTVV